MNIYDERRPTLNVDGAILWAGVPEECVGEIKLNTSIHVLLPHTGCTVTSCLALPATMNSIFSDWRPRGSLPQVVSHVDHNNEEGS